MGIPDVPYIRSAGAPPGVEVVEVANIAERARAHGIDPHAPSRLGFHLLLGVYTGVLECAVDFAPVAVHPGEWLWIRPNQTHEYLCNLRKVQGCAVLFVPSFLDAAVVRITNIDGPPGLGVWRGTRDSRRSAQMLADALQMEYASFGNSTLECHVETLRYLLSALLLKIGEQDPHAVPRYGKAFQDFSLAVEENFRSLHQVEAYARHLGYSTRTLTRSSISATGQGAKRYIDNRVLLEAKRLLIHTDLTADAVGRHLGFNTSSDFTRFIRHRINLTPNQFRENHR